MGSFRTLLLFALLPQASAFYGRIDNPAPTISAISPSKIVAGSPNQELTIAGRNFVSSSSVLYNGSQRSATFVSSSRLTIRLSAPDLSVPGTFTVVVATPPPGGGNSAAARLVVVQGRTD